MNSEFSVSMQRDLLPVTRGASVSRMDGVGPRVGAPPPSAEQKTQGGDRGDAKAKDDPDALDGTVADLNRMVQDMRRELQFQVDKDSGEVVVKVVDTQTGDVVRQIPPEEILRLRERLAKSAGAIFRASA